MFSDCVSGFTDLLSISPKRLPRFLPGYEGTENMFYNQRHPVDVRGVTRSASYDKHVWVKPRTTKN